MIKMPMNVAPLPAGEWQTTLKSAWDKLSDLERVARDYEGDGGRYIRPILLVQVERTGAEQADNAEFIHANAAYSWLKAVAGLYGHTAGMKALFERLAEAGSAGEDMPQLLRSHPLTQARLRSVAEGSLAGGWPTEGPLTPLSPTLLLPPPAKPPTGRTP